MTTISVMTPADFDFALKMTDIEKWGYLRTDFDRYIYFEPEGCFVARQDNNYVGMVTTISYDNFAFLGGLIVPEQFRGQGIGEKLMKHAISYLQQKGVHSIELDGTFPAVPIYRKLGFQDKYLSLRFYRNPKKISMSDNAQLAISIDDIIEFDRDKTGLNRERMLKIYYDQMPDRIFVEKEVDLCGYAIVKQRAGEESEIGPLVCDNAIHAEGLIRSIIVKFGGKPLSIGILEPNIDAVNIMKKFGFLYQLPSLRMYFGDKIDYEKYIYGIFSAGMG